MNQKEHWSVTVCRLIALIVCLAGIYWILNIFSKPATSPTESNLLGILLTISSTLVGWIVTHIYSSSQRRSDIADLQYRSQQNLRTYALKASEKVTNLSNELSRLAVYLEDELASEESEDARQSLHSKVERIESAIHLIRTLKSVNDTSLSDWEGVIGDELDEQREEQLEKEAEVAVLLERVESLAENQESAAELRAEINQLKYDIRRTAVELGTVPPKLIRSLSSKRKDIELPCPACGAQLKFRQKASATSVKAVPCPSCGSKLVSRYLPEGDRFFLERRIPAEVGIKCPRCQNDHKVMLDPLPTTSTAFACQCGATLKISRPATGEVRVKESTAPAPIAAAELTEDLLKLVKNRMPAQPWPHGTAIAVGAELGLSKTTMSRAVQELIKRGDFMVQMEGKLFAPVATQG